METKICNICGEEKEESEFSKDRKFCKACKRNIDKKYRESKRLLTIEDYDIYSYKKCSLCGEEKYLIEFPFYKGLFRSYCKGCYKLARKAYYTKNKQKEAQCNLEYRRRNPEKIRNIYREYRINNIDASRQKTRMRHARVRNYRGKIEKIDIAPLKIRQQNKCVYCNADLENGYHIDHIIPLSKGGEHVYTNIQLLCPTCNLRKNAKLPEVYEAEIGFDRQAYEEKIAA